jgi:arylsulfatase
MDAMTGNSRPTAADDGRPGRRRRRLVAVALLVLAGVAALVLGRRPERAAGPAAAPTAVRNVIVVVVDTLRADHLSAYGYARQTSPYLDAWAARNVLFTQARSQASCTFPSVNTILTARYPVAFLNQADGRIGIPAGIATLAEILAARGFATYAVSASPVVRKTPSRFNPTGEFDRGFDVFDEGCMWIGAECVRRKGLDLLTAHDPARPFFAYLHFIDPHDPYGPPRGHKRRWSAQPTGTAWVDIGDVEVLSKHLYAKSAIGPWDERHVRHLVDLYDDEIAYLDDELQRLLNRLERRGLLADTLVVLTADHGEELLEHGHVKHCRTVFDTESHIPMIWAVPGVAGGRRLDAPVGNVDVVPTILDFLGVASSDLGFEGRSLYPLLARGGAGPNDFTVSAQGSQRAITDGRHKLILGRAEDQPKLFDLANDPLETSDVAAEQVNLARRLRADLRRFYSTSAGGDETRSVAAAEEAQKRLQALGYIQ